jgi:hypothetical protein
MQETQRLDILLPHIIEKLDVVSLLRACRSAFTQSCGASWLETSLPVLECSTQDAKGSPEEAEAPRGLRTPACSRS